MRIAGVAKSSAKKALNKSDVCAVPAKAAWQLLQARNKSASRRMKRIISKITKKGAFHLHQGGVKSR